MFKDKLPFVIALILFGALSRLIPHLDNFAPIAAIGLFAGVYLRPRYLAALAPLGAMLLSDVLLFAFRYDYYDSFLVQRLFDYSVLTAVALSGGLLSKAPRNADFYLKTGGLAIGGSAAFYLVSNFGVWAQGGLYPMTFDGLVQCYVMGLPFYKATFAGDLIYTALFFGAAYFTIERKASSLAHE